LSDRHSITFDYLNKVKGIAKIIRITHLGPRSDEEADILEYLLKKEKAFNLVDKRVIDEIFSFYWPMIEESYWSGEFTVLYGGIIL